jgi:hypothetical protein
MVGPRAARRVVGCVIVLCGATSFVHAQVGAGAIVGTVIDDAGGAVPGATVTAINVATRSSRVAGPPRMAATRSPRCARACIAYAPN